MKFTKATAYALHALMYMVRHQTQLPIAVGTIARAENIPAAYLSKLFQKLMKAGLIHAEKGRHNGYTFARHPDTIALQEVLEVTEGRPLFNACPLQHGACGGTAASCAIYEQWHAISQQITQLFAHTSLASAAWNHPEHRFEDMPTRS